MRLLREKPSMVQVIELSDEKLDSLSRVKRFDARRYFFHLKITFSIRDDRSSRFDNLLYDNERGERACARNASRFEFKSPSALANMSRPYKCSVCVRLALIISLKEKKNATVTMWLSTRERVVRSCVRSHLLLQTRKGVGTDAACEKVNPSSRDRKNNCYRPR